MDFVAELGRAFLPSSDAFVFMWLLAALGSAGLFVTLERWFTINRRTDYDAIGLFEKAKSLIEAKRVDESYALCASGGGRALPRVLASGIRTVKDSPQLVSGAMSEESTHMASALERRLGYLVMFGNTATLFGLLGTVYGLIMSFTAVSRPEVAAVEKSALLAAGISTAMNATLVGLSISVLCVMAFAVLRSKVDSALTEIDRYAVAILNILNPPDVTQRPLKSLSRRSQDEEPADADVTPMLNLMIILIPVLLTSSEFVRMGAVQLKLPESSAGVGGEGGAAAQEIKLDAGIVITAKGFSLFHYFKTEGQTTPEPAGEKPVDVPMVNGQYDYVGLNERLVDVKKRALAQILSAAGRPASPDASIEDLYRAYASLDLGGGSPFPDHESIKIVAEDKIKYQTVIGVMDAARGVKVGEGNVTMFPNVAIAGGIVQ